MMKKVWRCCLKHLSLVWRLLLVFDSSWLRSIRNLTNSAFAVKLVQFFKEAELKYQKWSTLHLVMKKAKFFEVLSNAYSGKRIRSDLSMKCKTYYDWTGFYQMKKHYQYQASVFVICSRFHKRSTVLSSKIACDALYLDWFENVFFILQ